MSRPPIREVKLSDPKLSIFLCHRDADHPEGFWLYDEDVRFNLAVAAPSELEALVQAVQYWKERAEKSEAAHETLTKHVDAFVNLVHACDTEYP